MQTSSALVSKQEGVVLEAYARHLQRLIQDGVKHPTNPTKPLRSAEWYGVRVMHRVRIGYVCCDCPCPSIATCTIHPLVSPPHSHTLPLTLLTLTHSTLSTPTSLHTPLTPPSLTHSTLSTLSTPTPLSTSSPPLQPLPPPPAAA